jgi:CelD/BcsL family acetyltransferase involved in cellulose biosynthesis
MNIRLVDSEAEFDALEEEWNRLADRTSASIFSSFDYVRLAWKHFHKPTDRLLILVLEDETSVVGIAPFYITRYRRRGIPYRTVRFIAAWEGDRPRILAQVSDIQFWARILSFLDAYPPWEALDLAEQPLEMRDGNCGPCLARSGWYWDYAADATSWFVSLQGSWDEFLKGIKTKVRTNWRNRTKRLLALGVERECITDVGEIQKALARFIKLETSGWKHEAGIGVAKDERHQGFYDELLIRLAREGKASIYLMKVANEDVAGAIIFGKGEILYERHIAYKPAYSVYSPGIILRAEILKAHFGGQYKEYDMLGLSNNDAGQRHKSDWATGRRESAHWTGYRVYSRLLPLIIAKRLKISWARTSGREAPRPSRSDAYVE